MTIGRICAGNDKQCSHSSTLPCREMKEKALMKSNQVLIVVVKRRSHRHWVYCSAHRHFSTRNGRNVIVLLGIQTIKLMLKFPLYPHLRKNYADHITFHIFNCQRNIPAYLDKRDTLYLCRSSTMKLHLIVNCKSQW